MKKPLYYKVSNKIIELKLPNIEGIQEIKLIIDYMDEIIKGKDFKNTNKEITVPNFQIYFEVKMFNFIDNIKTIKKINMNEINKLIETYKDEYDKIILLLQTTLPENRKLELLNKKEKIKQTYNFLKNLNDIYLKMLIDDNNILPDYAVLGTKEQIDIINKYNKFFKETGEYPNEYFVKKYDILIKNFKDTFKSKENIQKYYSEYETLKRILKELSYYSYEPDNVNITEHELKQLILLLENKLIDNNYFYNSFDNDERLLNSNMNIYYNEIKKLLKKYNNIFEIDNKKELKNFLKLDNKIKQNFGIN